MLDLRTMAHKYFRAAFLTVVRRMSLRALIEWKKGMGPKTIFVVDDEAIISNTLSMILRQSGFNATPFSSPKKALEAISNREPDLLLSDVLMPEMSGVELAIQFRKIRPNCKVLLFSGQAATSDLLTTARSQGYDFDLLEKPVHPADLLAKIRS
jgi:DNA-binding NtrC family response regulator